MMLTLITGIGVEACFEGFGYHKKDVARAGGDMHRALFVSTLPW